MADSDQSLTTLRYNQVSQNLEAFGGGSPSWSVLTLKNVDPTQVPVTRLINTTAPLTGGGDLSADRTLSIPVATNSVNGYLSSADWTTFNAKQAAGSYITALTGAVTASGPGSAVASIASGAITPTTISAVATDDFTFPRDIFVVRKLAIATAGGVPGGDAQIGQPSAGSATLDFKAAAGNQEGINIYKGSTYEWGILKQPDETLNVYDGIAAVFPLTIKTLNGVKIPTVYDGTAFNNSNTAADASAQVDVSSTTKGLLGPRMTTTQQNAIASPAEGLEVYDSTLKKKAFYNGTSWQSVLSTLPGAWVLKQAPVFTTDGSTFTTNSATFVDTGVGLTFTPTSTSSQVILIYVIPCSTDPSETGYFTIAQNGSNLAGSIGLVQTDGVLVGQEIDYRTMVVVDTAPVASATDYRIFSKSAAGDNAYLNPGSSRVISMLAIEVGAA